MDEEEEIYDDELECDEEDELFAHDYNECFLDQYDISEAYDL
jgi:hypothetical protein